MKTDAKQVGKNILFVCSANINRSTTAELWFSWRNPENNYSSAGSSRYACNKYGGNYVTESQLHEADRIICMENRNKTEIEKQFGAGYSHKTEVAGIQDKYNFMELPLIFEFIDKISIESIITVPQ